MTATLTQDNAGITKELATGKFTDKMLADMRALIGTERELAAHGRRMAIAALDGSAVGRLFALAGANELLEIHPDCDTALAALAPRAT